MPQGTLANLAHSAFVRTPPAFAGRIIRCLLTFPQARPVTILDPTAGEGDLLLPCQQIPLARLYGVEISAERADVARARLPRADIVTCAIEGVSIPKASMSLVLANPPYFFQDGKRAEYRIIADAGTLLVPGGILVAIIPARSAWDGTMIHHWCRWYEDVRVWKFPDRESGQIEGAFEDFTQICVVGIRRAEPVDPSPAEQRQLQGYRYHTPTQERALNGSRALRSGWEQGVPPPDLPIDLLADPYPVPEGTGRPHIVVRHADESLLLAALAHGGAHYAPAWQSATEWREEGLREAPVMPLSGEAHVAAEVLTGLLDGEVVPVPIGREGTQSNEGTVMVPHLFTAFVGQEWVSLPVDEEEREKLRERGVVRVAARQWQDKPVLGMLNLLTGETRYEQGEAVFTALRPWLGTLAARVIEKRQPLYRLDPADWELQVVAEFGRDKQLPYAAFPGLSEAQHHRVYAMGRALDMRGCTAIHGEPGTGKTRLGVATAARQAYRWRHRTSSLFRDGQHPQPAWVRGLRQAWLKNPGTRALLGLTPVRDEETGRIVAYRRRDGTVISPEEAGPQALPVLVSTPKKVTKEYALEIRAAWPQTEVMHIAHHSDIPRWLTRCAHSSAPAVIGIVSHSLTRAFGRAWQPVMREKQVKRRVPALDPDSSLLPRLEPVQNAKGMRTGYRWKETGKPFTKEYTVSHFYCPDCGMPVKATPGTLHDVEKRTGDEETSLLPGKNLSQARVDGEEPDDDGVEPVTSRTWFTLKLRWCRCRSDARNQPGPRNITGRTRYRTPLWTDARLESVQQKHPQLAFADWYRAVHESVAYRNATSLGLATPLSKGKLSDQKTNQANGTQHTFVARAPLPDSFSPYEYLYRFYRGCVALAIIDESHNGRGRDTDIAHAHHQAMLAAQTCMLTSGTHYGGDVLGFFHYWYRFNPQFWRRLGLSWNDADKALERYGVIQEMTKEYESDARRGSGQTNVQVSTIPAPGLSAKLIPYLLEDLVYLTVLDVGAHMPPRIEIPEIVSLRDTSVEQPLDTAEKARWEAAHTVSAYKKMQRDTGQGGDDPRWQRELERRQQTLAQAVAHEQEVKEWSKQRHLANHYRNLVRELDELSQKRNMAARLAKGTVPRWFAALPCDKPFEVWQTTRDQWGDTLDRQLLVSTETLEWNHLYPLERRLLSLVERERAEGRRIMLYFEQNDVRTMARRLEWVLQDLHPWTLPNKVAAEDRQQAILQAVQQGRTVVIVPYRRVNEGLNLQSGIDTIVWVEMALNLFMLDQASRRAWRLGKREEVRIYYMAYANTAGHYKLRKLGQQSGAAAAFAGEPARGALIEHAGADKTTLARLSSLLEQQEEEAENASFLLSNETEVAQEEAELKAVFAQRADELRTALQRGRQWLGGLADTLPERLNALLASSTPVLSVWNTPQSLSESISVNVHSIETAPKAGRRSHDATEQTSEPERRSSLDVHVPEESIPHRSADMPSALPGPVPEPAHLPVSGVEGEQVAVVVPAVGSRAAVIFGRREHIALVRLRGRTRRKHTASDYGKLRHPVVVRDIPSLAEQEQDAIQNGPGHEKETVVVPSLWESLGADSSTTANTGNLTTGPTAFPTTRQTNLWERVTAHS